MTEPLVTPTTTPITEPLTEPIRRMEPGRVCPAQRRRLGEKIKRVLDP
jgi:hypothetical protein